MEEIALLVGVIVVIAIPWIFAIFRARRTWKKADKMFSCIIAVALFPVSWLMSYDFSYMDGKNLRIVGAPIMSMAWQRDSEVGPWLDYVGLVTILSPLLKYIIFATTFCVLWIIFSYFRKTSLTSN